MTEAGIEMKSTSAGSSPGAKVEVINMPVRPSPDAETNASSGEKEQDEGGESREEKRERSKVKRVQRKRVASRSRAGVRKVERKSQRAMSARSATHSGVSLLE